MRFQISNLTLPFDHKEADLTNKAAQMAGCCVQDFTAFHVIRRSLDARKRLPKPQYVYLVEAETDATSKLKPGIQIVKESTKSRAMSLPAMKNRPIVVGTGPAGLFAALTLARAGTKPLVIERGSEAATRDADVKAFWKSGSLNTDSNVLYGEGGAGLFSDGKLTSRTKDRRRLQIVLQSLVDCGAPEDTLIDASPHLGSDVLLRITPAMRELIRSCGGEFRFSTRLESLHIEKGSLRGLQIAGSGVRADACVLATGHSARDVYEMLHEHQVALEAKSFAVGLRVEVRQELVDRSQFGEWAGDPRLGSASFRLTYRGERGLRDVYSFCMCPGGRVIPCASSEGQLTTNGMSYSGRSGRFANAAFLVPVTPDDFGEHTLGGIDFQAMLERAAFEAGGNDYSLPAQTLDSFLHASGRSNSTAGSCPRSRCTPLRQILPDFVADSLAAALAPMLKKIGVKQRDEVTLYGTEVRSSSPVRILRNEMGQSPTIRGLFPAGEGSGYAGGIVSSSIDGIRAAESLLNAEL